MPVIDEIKEQQKKVKNLSLKGRIHYFWDYYRIHTIVIILAVVLISFFIRDLILGNREEVLSIAVINSPITLDDDAIMNDFASYADIDLKKYQANLDSTMTLKFSSGDSSTENTSDADVASTTDTTSVADATSDTTVVSATDTASAVDVSTNDTASAVDVSTTDTSTSDASDTGTSDATGDDTSYVPSSTDVATTVKIMANYSLGDLDVIIANPEVFDYYAKSGVFVSLDSILGKALLAKYADQLYTCNVTMSESGVVENTASNDTTSTDSTDSDTTEVSTDTTPFTCGIDVTGSSLYKTDGSTSTATMIMGFVYNQKHLENSLSFLNYIMQ